MPNGSVANVKFAVVSCSNYPAGYFHVYEEIAKLPQLDAIIHLGDYLYEYASDGYASEKAADMGRIVVPTNELISLADYRIRYGQYRLDAKLQMAHAAAPLIAIWDDHEVANDTWREGAENHNEGEGLFEDRLAAALQAYAEWMPIRPAVDEDLALLQRNFQYGDLVNLSMLDTRLVARDKQLALADYFDESGFNSAAYSADISDTSRTLLGADQREWLIGQFSNRAQWQVLGQQVLMGRMELPTAIATAQLSIAEFAELAKLAQIAATNPEQLSQEQLALVSGNGYLLQLGSLPYNLDAWDGYPVERATVLSAAKAAGSQLVVLAGDTHNAWVNDLTVDNSNVGIELGVSSVSSPGLEQYLGLENQQQVTQAELGLVQLIEGLQQVNLSDRGFLVVTFTTEAMQARFEFVSNVQHANYSLLADRAISVTVNSKS